MFADSGVEYLKYALMQDPARWCSNRAALYDNPELMRGILVHDDAQAAFRGRFTVLAPKLNDQGYYSGVRYGLENESSRLNLNTVLLADNYEEDGCPQGLLMALPGMTESIADAILDWLDPRRRAAAAGGGARLLFVARSALRAAQRPAAFGRGVAAGARRDASPAVRRRPEPQRPDRTQAKSR